MNIIRRVRSDDHRIVTDILQLEQNTNCLLEF